MSTTEELIEATVTKDGTATVNILGTTHEFTAASEAAARVETVELVSKHAKQRGAVVRAVMRDDQGSWPVKVHPDGTVEPDTTTPPASSDKPAARRSRVDSPVTHVASAETAVIEEPAMREEATAAAPEPPATAETAPEPEKPAKEPAQAADTRQSATQAPAGPSSATAKAPQPNPFAQKSQSRTRRGTCDPARSPPKLPHPGTS